MRPEARPDFREVERVAADLKRARRLLCLGELDAGLARAGRWCEWLSDHERFLLVPLPGRGVTIGEHRARGALRRELGELLGVVGLVLMADQRDDQAAEAFSWAKIFTLQDDPLADAFESMAQDLGGW